MGVRAVWCLMPERAGAFDEYVAASLAGMPSYVTEPSESEDGCVLVVDRKERIANAINVPMTRANAATSTLP